MTTIYTPTNWKDQEVEKPRTYTMVTNDDGTVSFTDAFGVITEAGTPVDAEHLNKLESGLFNLSSETSQLDSTKADKTELEEKANISDLSTVATSGNFNDLVNKPDLSSYATVTGVANALTTKQNTLTAGNNITIVNDVISATNTGSIDHNSLINRSMGDQHPISAITGLTTELDNKQDTLIAGDNITIVDNVISSTGGGEDLTYTNTEPSVVEVGGIAVGSTFDNQTMKQMFDNMLYPEKNPSLSNPSNTFKDNAPILVEINSPINIILTSTFSRGTIHPAYETSGFRSGLPTTYNYTGYGLPNKVSSTSLTNDQTITDFVITTPKTETWTSSVTYSAGEQPLTSKGNNYSTPLASGTTSPKTVSVTGVYPNFATTATIDAMTKLPLTSPTVSFIEVVLVGETETEKQSIELSYNLPAVTGIEFYNTVSKTWEWLGGDKTASVSIFGVEVIEKMINGYLVSYNKYTNKSAKIGSRQLRFYI